MTTIDAFTNWSSSMADYSTYYGAVWCRKGTLRKFRKFEVNDKFMLSQLAGPLIGFQGPKFCLLVASAISIPIHLTNNLPRRQSLLQWRVSMQRGSFKRLN